MMKKNTVSYKVLLLIYVVSANISVAAAQKLPKIQHEGSRAPDKVQIDAKITEWGGKFQAYNPNNRINYTIANDDDNLYLVLQAKDTWANEKAFFGITFTIKLPAANGSKLKENVMIVYPQNVAVKLEEPIRNTVRTIRQWQNDTTKVGSRKKDSLRLIVNNKIGIVFKEMDVAGIKEIPDPSIAIYNTQGIKAAIQIDEHMRYIYELAIPLKYLGVAINNGKQFKYNLKINGVPARSPGSVNSTLILPVGSMTMDNAFVNFATDFSGTYSLVKK
jgi:hypothetical protein